MRPGRQNPAISQSASLENRRNPHHLLATREDAFRCAVFEDAKAIPPRAYDRGLHDSKLNLISRNLRWGKRRIALTAEGGLLTMILSRDTYNEIHDTSAR